MDGDWPVLSSKEFRCVEQGHGPAGAPKDFILMKENGGETLQGGRKMASSGSYKDTSSWQR